MTRCAILFDHHEPSRHRHSVPRDEPIRRRPAANAWRFPGLPAPVVRNAGGEREMVLMRWECHRRHARAARLSRIFATPRPRIGGVGSNLRAGALSQRNSFAEYAPEPNAQIKKKDVVWFALNDDRPLFAFGGLWTEFKGDRGTKSKPIPGPHLVYGFLTPHRTRSSRRSTQGPCR